MPSYSQEVNEVITSLRQSLSDVSGSAQQAVASLQCAEGAMQKVTFLQLREDAARPCPDVLT